MAWTAANPIVIGAGTRKSHYDKVWDNIDYLDKVLSAPSGTIMLFGSVTPPTGWTRKTNWQDDSALCYSASGSLGSGGGVAAPNAHTHTAGYTLDDDDNHAHGQGTLNLASEGSHAHTAAGGESTVESTHEHSTAHQHDAISTNGQHMHKIYGLGPPASPGYVYNSAGTKVNIGSVSDGYSGLRLRSTPPGGPPMFVGYMHVTEITSGTWGQVPVESTMNGGSHHHELSGTTGAASASHDHALSGSLSNEGHTHSLSGTVVAKTYYYQEVAAASKD